MGATVARGETEATVVHTGKDTFFGRTAMLLSTGGDEMGNINKIILRLTLVLTVRAFFVCYVFVCCAFFTCMCAYVCVCVCVYVCVCVRSLRVCFFDRSQGPTCQWLRTSGRARSSSITPSRI